VPPGDSKTSKRLFDALTNCCMPVLVDVAGANPEYEFWSMYSFLIQSDLRHLVTHLPPGVTGPELFDAMRNTTRQLQFAQLANATRVFGLPYAAEDHPKYFDVVDRIVHTLAANAQSQC